MASSKSSSGVSDAQSLVALCCTLALTFALSMGLASRFFYIVNPDSIAMLRLADYWWHGQWRLAVSSYWGPLFPIMVSPLRALGVEPFMAARIAMVASAIIYVLGARSLLKSLGLVAIPLEFCTFLVGITGALYSAMAPTADLLLSGLASFGLALLLSANWRTSRKVQCASGLLFGLAFLAKAVALPMAVLLVTAIALFRAWKPQEQRRQVLSAVAVTFLSLGLAAGPWIATLSFKFDKFMFSSSGSLNHAIAGPTDVDRYHPVGRTFHKPAEGRMFAGEDPYGMPYKHWSPFESQDYLNHQLALIKRNANFILNGLGAGMVALALLALVLVRPWRAGSFAHWPWALPMVILMSCLYLPVFAGSARYYLLSFPVLYAAATMVPIEIGRRVGLNARIALFAAIIFSGLLAAFYQIRPAWRELHEVDGDYGFAVRQALPMAWHIANSGNIVEVASVGDDYRVGLFISFVLDSRWLGNMQDPPLDAVKNSGAQLIVVKSGHHLLPQMLADAAFTEQIAPAPLAGVQQNGRPSRYFWYKKATDTIKTRHE